MIAFFRQRPWIFFLVAIVVGMTVSISTVVLAVRNSPEFIEVPHR